MRAVRGLLWMVGLGLVSASVSAEPLPMRLAGSWRIARVLPTGNSACWARAQAAPLVGSTLTYMPHAMKWRGGQVKVEDITTRLLTHDEFRKENSGSGGAATFEQLGVRSPSVLEVDMQHEDMDITGSTTEVPGDSVLLVAPNRIVVSACGVYMEATRASGMVRTSARR